MVNCMHQQLILLFPPNLLFLHLLKLIIQYRDLIALSYMQIYSLRESMEKKKLVQTIYLI